ncbi:MAG: hypothetical protein HYR51_13085 [Candidatus Rokubacteria bacterium]|nr:hypothetical protein [Candidatus Rokubacteria bacterium]
MADDRDDESGHRRRLKFRQRDDHAVELFEEARARLDDTDRVNRILLELGKFYNPYVDAPIVDLATRRRILEALASGDRTTALALLDERLTAYTGGTDPDTGD